NVLARAGTAFTREIKNLESAGFDWHSPAASSTGYQIWKQYLSGNLTKPQALNLWITQEIQYAKRQMTWFKKQKQINWFDVSQANYYTQVDSLVKAWYSK